MKTLKSLTLALLILGSPVQAFAEIEEIVWLPEKVFTPNGFDDNDQVQITLHGHFPSSCYRASTATAKIVDGKVTVINKAYHDKTSLCFAMMIPWTTTVSLGSLPKGNYAVEVMSKTEEPMPYDKFVVGAARSVSIDEYLYAYVNSLMVKVDPRTRVPTITISGSFGMTCLFIKEIKILREENDVIVVLPIVGMDKPETCGYPFVPIPFRKTLVLAQPLLEKATLFHVRSLNGQAINQVVDL